MSRPKYGAHVARTPQTEPIPGREADMVANAAGGFAFKVDAWTRLRRFLILGAEGGTYYVGERELARGCAAYVRDCIVLDAARTVQEIVDVSSRGLAPKNDPALFALALCARDARSRDAALAALPQVARIGTHLFSFFQFSAELGGWPRSIRRALARWYTSKSTEDLALQLLKYQQREGVSHRDVLRIAHAKPPSLAHDNLFRMATRSEEHQEDVGKTKHPRRVRASREIASALGDVPQIVHAFRRAHADDLRPDELTDLIRTRGLAREMLPTAALSRADVWEALLPRMKPEALVRNLGNMTKVGLLKPGAAATRAVCERLRDGEAIKRSRIHPMKVLVGAATYRSGRGVRGSGAWEPVGEIDTALDDAFMLAFGNLEPTGKRVGIYVDHSGSMQSPIATAPGLTCAQAAAAMASMIARQDGVATVHGFGARGPDGFAAATSLKWRSLGMYSAPQGISPLPGNWQRDTVVSLTRGIQGLSFGATDCALPMLHALERGLEVDCFVILTDNESWAGPVHPSAALAEYRRKTGIPARVVACAMTATDYSCGDPADAGTLNVCGLDASVPELVSAFARGDV